jgi:hypothetical protein
VDNLSELKRKPSWFWGAVFLAAVFMIAALASDQFRLPLAVATIATFAVIYVGTNRHEKRVAQLQAETDAKRLPQLTHDVMMNGATLSVHASSFFWAALVVLVLGVVTSFAAVVQSAIGTGIAAVLVDLTGLLMAALLIPTLGKPVMMISKAGIQTPSHGLIPWQEIEGIHLARVTARGETQGHRLNLLVPTLPSHLDRMHPFTRALHRMMLRIKPLKMVAIRLFSPSESATLIESLCRELWKEKTGRTRIWSPDMPPALQNASTRAEALLREFAAADKAGDEAKFIALASTLDQEQKLVQSELKKATRSQKWINAIAFAALILFLLFRLWPIVSRQLSK